MVKRKGRAKEALNLKRFRESVKQLGNSATKKENDSDSQEEHEHEQESEQPRKRSRKLVRKEQRQLKKMRQNAFQRRDKVYNYYTYHYYYYNNYINIIFNIYYNM